MLYNSDKACPIFLLQTHVVKTTQKTFEKVVPQLQLQLFVVQQLQLLLWLRNGRVCWRVWRSYVQHGMSEVLSPLFFIAFLKKLKEKRKTFVLVTFYGDQSELLTNPCLSGRVQLALR